jgi:hypothetical protein
MMTVGETRKPLTSVGKMTVFKSDDVGAGTAANLHAHSGRA